ncbi:MAG TPA: hypothetical protein VH986_08395 [Acidimicrobiia bacterium]|jgi:hypothetical protein
MSVAEFFEYRMAREPTRSLGLQLVEVYDERLGRRAAQRVGVGCA